MVERIAPSLDACRTRRLVRGAVVAVVASVFVAAVPAQATEAGGASVPTIRLLTPKTADNLAIGGVISLSAAAPKAASVKFRARWTDADGISRWHAIGTDRSPADGFSFKWSTAGLKTQKRLTIQALGLTKAGSVQGRSGTAVVSRAASEAVPATTIGPTSPAVTAQSVPTAPSHQLVVGTCAASACILNHRSGPGASNALDGTSLEGQTLTVVCQSAGELVSTKSGRSNVWDKLSDGTWVSDLYLDTAGRGVGFTATLARC